jgi:hypothetical protein
VGAVLPHALDFIYRSLEHDATAYMASMVADVNLDWNSAGVVEKGLNGISSTWARAEE